MTIEQFMRDVDPDFVARNKARRLAWAERIGHPKRCETNEVHPGLGCCLFCGADSGQSCLRTPKGTPDDRHSQGR